MSKQQAPAGKAQKPGFWKELWRKFMVALKRRPQMIPLAVFVVGFVFYSLNLMHISDTTARIQGPGMGLAGFATMLFSMLAFMCFLNAFPYRKKTNVPMLVLMFLLIGIVIFADVYYLNAIYAAVLDPANPLVVTNETIYIVKAERNLQIHIAFLCAGIVLTLLLPVYSNLLRKVKTSIEVDDNGSMGAIDISSED